MTHDYTGHEDPAPKGDDAMARLSRMGDELFEIRRQQKAGADRAKAQQKRAQELEEKLIPDLMKSVGQENFGTATASFTLVDQVHVNISKAREVRAHKWLDDNGHGDIIKRHVIVEFGRDNEEAARALAAELEKTYESVTEKKAVHAGTLKAWARELLAAGKEVPKELFGLHVRRVAVLKEK